MKRFYLKILIHRGIDNFQAYRFWVPRKEDFGKMLPKIKKLILDDKDFKFADFFLHRFCGCNLSVGVNQIECEGCKTYNHLIIESSPSGGNDIMVDYSKGFHFRCGICQMIYSYLKEYGFKSW